MPTLSDFTAVSLQGADTPLATYDGQVVLVVNTASQCGLTPQYAGLERLYEKFSGQGLAVLGFPCDQFAHQEPGDADEISSFCTMNYGVTFPMFAKVDVNGDNAHPLFGWLRKERSGLLGGAIKWNFTKFLINRQGEVLNRYAPTTTPEKLEPDVVAALAA